MFRVTWYSFCLLPINASEKIIFFNTFFLKWNESWIGRQHILLYLLYTRIPFRNINRYVKPHRNTQFRVQLYHFRNRINYFNYNVGSLSRSNSVCIITIVITAPHMRGSEGHLHLNRKAEDISMFYPVVIVHYTLYLCIPIVPEYYTMRSSRTHPPIHTYIHTRTRTQYLKYTKIITTMKVIIVLQIVMNFVILVHDSKT